MNEQSKIIWEYLQQAYVGARMTDDVETMCRLSRAILVFEYDVEKDLPSWDELIQWSISQEENGTTGEDAK